MARENKAKRNARRFGIAERLADRLFEKDILSECVIPIFWDGAPSNALARILRSELDTLRELASVGMHVDFSNVAEFYFAVSGQEKWDYERDFPSCRPPSPVLFLEATRPSGCRIGNTFTVDVDTTYPSRWAVVVETLPAKLLPPTDQDPVIQANIVPFLSLPDIYAVLRMSVVARRPVQMTFPEGIMLPAGAYYLPIDRFGNVLANAKTFFVGHPGSQPGDVDDHSAYIGQLIQAALLAVSFMNCKNVSLATVEPNARLNRERRKAGLKPFLRFQTIDIEPMKQVLKTEGRVETEGLQRALHLCRGHFARYTDNFFGRHLDEPIMVWRPLHARGSLESGAVISDYRVRPPE